MSQPESFRVYPPKTPITKGGYDYRSWFTLKLFKTRREMRAYAKLGRSAKAAFVSRQVRVDVDSYGHTRGVPKGEFGEFVCARTAMQLGLVTHEATHAACHILRLTALRVDLYGPGCEEVEERLAYTVQAFTDQVVAGLARRGCFGYE